MSDETAPEPGIDFDALSAPFEPSTVHWRPGYIKQGGKEGIALAYVDARDVQDRLDAVCTPGGWKCEHKEVAGRLVCTLSLRILREDGSYEWVGKEDGAGDTAIEGEKGGLSDALKRAAVQFGIARYLYRLPDVWVKINNNRPESLA